MIHYYFDSAKFRLDLGRRLRNFAIYEANDLNSDTDLLTGGAFNAIDGSASLPRLRSEHAAERRVADHFCGRQD